MKLDTPEQQIEALRRALEHERAVSAAERQRSANLEAAARRAYALAAATPLRAREHNAEQE